MGLDMYLYKREYISGWNFRGDEDTSFYDSILEYMNAERCEGSPHANVEVCVAYWRKANAIHGWFVENLANGVDECQSIYVTKENLIELRDLAASALKEPAMAGDILPPTPGFFFGSYDIDEWYMEDMKLTVEQIDKVLESVKDKEYADFIYRASW